MSCLQAGDQARKLLLEIPVHVQDNPQVFMWDPDGSVVNVQSYFGWSPCRAIMENMALVFWGNICSPSLRMDHMWPVTALEIVALASRQPFPSATTNVSSVPHTTSVR
ncbi:hypothetical protein KM043_012379 [Ampulex compressa]|nr:hypothetical protein KM043_012379 [Ampulex compressa]